MEQAIRFHETGGPEVLRLEDVVVGEPGPGEVRLRHVAVGLNFADTYFRNGTYPIPLPAGMGVEATGVVEAVGPGVTNVAVGDKVTYTGFLNTLGAYSTARIIAAEPLISYHPSFTGRTRIDQAFAARKLSPRIALEAIDSDVIKTYVRLGLGIGIVAEMAVRDDTNADLVVRPLGHLLGQNVARVAFKRSAYLRNFVFKFAELLSDRLNRDLIGKAMTGHVNDYEL